MSPYSTFQVTCDKRQICSVHSPMWRVTEQSVEIPQYMWNLSLIPAIIQIGVRLSQPTIQISGRLSPNCLCLRRSSFLWTKSIREAQFHFVCLHSFPTPPMYRRVLECKIGKNFDDWAEKDQRSERVASNCREIFHLWSIWIHLIPVNF